MTIDTAIWMAHLSATLFMTGVIWFVQLSQYPLFTLIDAPSMPIYAVAHARRTTWVVGPAMVLEVATALWLLWHPVFGVPLNLWLVNLGLMTVIWLSTAFFSVPCHHLLSQGHDRAVIDLLVRSNWVRTVGWSLRSGLLVWILGQQLRALPEIAG